MLHSSLPKAAFEWISCVADSMGLLKLSERAMLRYSYWGSAETLYSILILSLPTPSVGHCGLNGKAVCVAD
jgi:hypothetical protein